MFNIHIHIGPTDNDLLMLYKYLPCGLGKTFKNIIMSYYKGEKYSLPTLKHSNKSKVESVKVYFNEKEKEIIKPLLELDSKSSVIKNLTRMYFAKTLADICKPIFNAPKDKYKERPKEVKEVKDEVKEVKNETQKNDYIERQKPEITNDKPRKMPNIFMPKEY